MVQVEPEAMLDPQVLFVSTTWVAGPAPVTVKASAVAAANGRTELSMTTPGLTPVTVTVAVPPEETSPLKLTEPTPPL